jgi:hypothetical protein
VFVDAGRGISEFLGDHIDHDVETRDQLIFSFILKTTTEVVLILLIYRRHNPKNQQIR